MPRRKLFHGSNYVGVAVSDSIYRALWLNALRYNVTIADVLRSVLAPWEKSPHAAIPQDELVALELALEELRAQRKGNGPGHKD
jgi:hypothetical protein